MRRDGGVVKMSKSKLVARRPDMRLVVGVMLVFALAGCKKDNTTGQAGPAAAQQATQAAAPPPVAVSAEVAAMGAEQLREAASAALREQLGGLDAYLWAHVDGQPVQNRWASLAECPAKTPLSDAISRDLARRGFKFVGSTIIYAYLQGVGVVNDHVQDCHCHGRQACA